jgi:peptidoglycan hydrolase CwlO-like protein
MGAGWRILAAIIAIAAMGFALFSANKIYQRDERTSRIREQQESIQVRIDALKKEMDEAKPPFDPGEVKSRQERLKALQEDLDAVKREVGGNK